MDNAAEEARVLTLWNQAINAGNFAEAYGGGKGALWAIRQGQSVRRTALLSGSEVILWMAGFVLGYLCTFEWREVPEEDAELFLAALVVADCHGLYHLREAGSELAEARLRFNPVQAMGRLRAASFEEVDHAV